MIDSVTLHRTDAREITAYTTWYSAWQLDYRRVYGLTDTPRTVARIAEMLHRPAGYIHDIASDLVVGGYIRKFEQREETQRMNALLLQESLDLIGDKDAFARRVYERLFAASPEVELLFKDTNMRTMRTSLMAAIAYVVRGVNAGEHLVPKLRELGDRHAAKGVLPEHYPIVGAALLATFADTLGPDWTPEMHDAWTQAYAAISAQMIQGAQHAAQ